MQATTTANNEWAMKLQQVQRAAADAENKSAIAERQVITVMSELDQQRQMHEAKLEQAQATAAAALQLATDDASEARSTLSQLQEQVQVETAAREKEVASLREQIKELEAKRQQAAEDAWLTLAMTWRQGLLQRCAAAPGPQTRLHFPSFL